MSGPHGVYCEIATRRQPGAEPVVVFYVPTYGWGYSQSAQPAAATASAPAAASIDRKHERPTGSVRLDVQPNGALQVFVDGYYVGTPNDFNGELELEAGPHTIELRADLYQTLTFDAKIAPGRSITYRGALTPTRVESDPDPAVGREPVIPNGPRQTVAPATPTTIYFIPGCYLGNVPPENVALPANCDLSRLITRKSESR